MRAIDYFKERTMRVIVAFALCLSCVGSFPQVPTEKQSTSILRRTPPVEGWRYRCEEMIRVVNQLRQLGKDKSLTILREYTESDGAEEDKVLVICRLLFLNPKGWNAPRIGQPRPDIDKEARKHFPVFSDRHF
jgi:hypothetical protein